MRWVGLAFLVVSFVAAGGAEAQEALAEGSTPTTETPSAPMGDGVPAGSVIETRDYVPVGIAGLATFGASWVATIVLGATTNSGDKKKAAGHAIVPVGGPFIMLAEGSHAEDLEGVLAGLGVLQGLGLGAALLGFTLESKVIVDRSGAFVAPVVGPAGIGLTGAF
jgi:hypothetical protein